MIRIPSLAFMSFYSCFSAGFWILIKKIMRNIKCVMIRLLFYYALCCYTLALDSLENSSEMNTRTLECKFLWTVRNSFLISYNALLPCEMKKKKLIWSILDFCLHFLIAEKIFFHLLIMSFINTFYRFRVSSRCCDRQKKRR